MNVLDIISQLREVGVSIRFDQGNLKLVGKTNELGKELLTTLKNNKVEIINFLKENQQKPDADPIKKIDLAENYPLSNAQKRIWVLSQFEGGNSAYNIGTSLYLKGEVSPEALEKSFQICVNRHDSLRTVFKEVNEEPVQIVLSHIEAVLDQEDVIQQSEINKYLFNEVKKMNNHRFDLENGPLVSFKLIRFSSDEYALLFSMHHIISDGWSAGIMLQEIMSVYKDICVDTSVQNNELDIQYKDFTAWLNNKLNGEFGKEAEEFWGKKKLNDLEPVDLPYDFKRPEVNRFEGGLNKFYFDSEFYRAIEKFAVDQRTTVFNVYRASISLLLHKLASIQSVCLGTPVSGRSHHQLSDQLGLYVNTLPLVSTIDKNQSFSDYLSQLTQDTLDLFKYQDYPLDLIIEKQDIKRDASRNPLFDVLVVVQNTAIGDGSIEIKNQHGFTMESMDKYLNGAEYTEKNDVPAKFDLTFNFAVEPDNKYYIEIEYSTQLFKRSSIQRLYSGFRNILRQVIQSPSVELSEISLINREEKDTILNQFNNKILPLEITDPLGHLDLKLKNPTNEIAVLHKERKVTYSEVEEYSNGYASKLEQLGKNKIGLFCQRSEEIVFAVLGAIKSGTCYVPIDTKYPEERIEFIIEDSQLDVILTDRECESLIPNSFKGKMVFMEDVTPRSERINSSIDQDSTAYMIYTSGSTGKPKGVEISRTNLSALLNWAKGEFESTPYHILYAATSYCFDLSIFEMLFPLAQGKTIRILDSALQIEEYINTEQHIFVNTVPSVVRNLLDNNMSWSNVVALNMAGEPVPRVFKDLLNYREIEVRNLYGPSEDTTYSTCYRFTNDGKDYIPIGQPIKNTQAYILDENLNLLPIGVEGEIYLSGAGVAKGYLGRKELSSERFIDNPFVSGEKMYQTGDVAKWGEDGQLIFVGRNDDQVKLRGFRIELGEIQYQIELMPSIKQAVVVIDEMNNEPVLVAYFEKLSEIDEQQIKQHLQEHLPAYMSPDIYIELDSIPLNNNGKVDKNRLPKPERQSSVEMIEPQTPTQELLFELWQEVLGPQSFGVLHSFFELGGHSLKATKLRSLVSKRMEKSLTLNEIFLNPTILAQSEIIDSKGITRETKVQQVSVEPKGEYPLSLAQERLWVLTQFEEASKAYHMPAAFKIQGKLNTDLLDKALMQVIHKHEILRTKFHEGTTGPVQKIIPKEEVQFSLKVTQLESQEELNDTLSQEWSNPFDLQSGELIRCNLFQLKDQSVLSFNMHHIISDGWSIGVLFADVVKAYSLLIANSVDELQPLEIQYKDFAIWQKNELKEEVLNKHLKYWREEVFSAGDIPLELPYDKARPEIKTYNGSTHIKTFSKTLTEGIWSKSREMGVSPFMNLLAQVNILLKKLSNQDVITIGTPVSGRDSSQLQEQIGFYVNTLPIRTEVSGEASFEDLLLTQRTNLLSAFNYQHFPFEMLVEELQLQRNMSRSPLFDVMVVMQNFDVLDIPKLNLAEDILFEKYEHNSDHTKYDLTFSFAEINDQLQLELEYNTDLFYKTTVSTFVDRLETIFQTTLTNPEISIEDISVLGKDELKVLTSKADQTHISHNVEETILSRFNSVVNQFSDKVAVKYNDQSLTYAQLDDQSGRLAGYIKKNYSTQKEDLIVLHLDRSPQMLVSILAVLKAGAAYVPVDPSYPASRIEYIVNDSSPALVITDQELNQDRKNLIGDAKVLTLEGKNFTEEPYQELVSPEQLAYIIYTSGTTGNPKGVQIEHGHVNRLLFNSEDIFDFDEKDVWTMFHSYCFDFSVWEMYGALLKGGKLVVVAKELAQDSVSFFDLLSNEKVTVLNQTPTAFRSLSASNNDRFDKTILEVRYLIFGGEKLSPITLQEWNTHYPTCKLVNMYGITETTVHVTYKEITEVEIRENKSNIGIPIPTLSCYVLDNDLNICPIGVTGELCIGGAGVARGYLNQPELTKEKFIQHPLSGGQRLYRSGDYGRVLENGDLEYIGRRDDQVKIRGHRIELNEVEVGVMSIKSIKEAVVQVIKNGAGENELAAYIILNEENSEGSFRDQLEGVLPAYMVPDHFVQLEEFPKTSNGKLNTTALPDVNEMDIRKVEYVPPKNEIEEKIVKIWEEVLQKEGIGIQDNFFDLGGHSLKATRVVVGIQAEFGVKIDLKNLFLDPTVENLANYVETLVWMDEESSVEESSEEEELIL